MARKNKDLPGRIRIWSQFVALYIEIFRQALELVQITDEMKKYEPKISEELCPKLRDMCFNNKYKPETPRWEQPKMPITQDEVTKANNVKRPDFTCSFVDTSAESPEMHEISLHIECKRLGIKMSSWDLNKNYIDNGIKRFDSLTHECGKRADDGIMIGYIISSNKSDIQQEINSNLPANIERLKFNEKVKLRKLQRDLNETMLLQ
jgi:hypothetical protein